MPESRKVRAAPGIDNPIAQGFFPSPKGPSEFDPRLRSRLHKSTRQRLAASEAGLATKTSGDSIRHGKPQPARSDASALLSGPDTRLCATEWGTLSNTRGLGQSAYFTRVLSSWIPASG